MSIRISRNAAGNCLTFHGQTNPVYYNACLSAEVIDTEYVNIINDIASNENETRYEYYRIHFSEFQSADFNTFADAQAVVDYLAEVGNVTAQNDAVIFGPEDTLDFQLDATSTSVIFDNGDHHGVNSIKAVALPNGLVSIQAMLSDHEFYQLPHTGCTIHGDAIPGGLNDVVNALNEYFTVGAFEQVVIRDPYSTMVADVGGTLANGSLVGALALDPAGTDIGASSRSHNHNAGWLSTDTIDQAGEYFTFDIRVRGQIGFGLVHSDDSFNDGHYPSGTNTTYADPSTFCNGVNSAHYGWQFSHHFHPTPNGPWTNYGGNTSYVGGPGWTSTSKRFASSAEANDWQNGDPVKMKVGLDSNSFIEIAYYDVSESEWVMCARSAYPVIEGAEYKLGIKFPNSTVRLNTAPKIHLLEPAAPVMHFRFIESPDGYYSFPLFATEAEADYYELTESGSDNGSHTHVYPDDPTYTTWYMPSTQNQMDYGMTPVEDGVTTFQGNPIVWTEITSLNNSDLIPPTFSAADLSVDENESVNYQTQPMDTAYTTTITNLPIGLLDMGGGIIGGTAPEVTGDTTSNPSDTYTVTVTRTNSYGSSSGTLNIIVNNLTAPVVNPITGFDFVGGTALVDSDTMDAGSVVSITETIGDGERMVIDREWADALVQAVSSGSGTKRVWIGFKSASSDFSGGATRTGFDLMYEFYNDGANRANNNWRLRVMQGSNQLVNLGVGSLTSALYDYVFINDGGEVTIAGLVASGSNDASTYYYDSTDAYWKNDHTFDTGVTGAKTIYIATENTQLDLTTSGIADYSEPPAPSAPILTPWTKALDFSGSAERCQQVSVSSSYNPVMMGYQSVTVAAPATAGYTTSATNSHPWATAIVFKPDGNSSNQHIWNVGEGSGSTDDNIYCRLDASGNLYFGWGRSGAVNECVIGAGFNSGSGTNQFWGLYIASNGTRLSGANATAANLAAAFDIRIMNNQGGTWQMAGAGGSFADADGNRSTVTNWSRSGSSIGARMDRAVQGATTVGGRGANRNFHGKVASMVITTLRRGQLMPDSTEITKMVTDPKRWINEDKVGQPYRLPYSTTEATFARNNSGSAYSTQVWLMGDGQYDAFAQIRNEVYPTIQNIYPLNMISMVSNDIQNVTISGLS